MARVVDSNAREFLLELRKEANMVQEEATNFYKEVTTFCWDGIVDRTPVDTGRTKGNWQLTLGQPATSELDVLDPSGEETKARGYAVIDRLEDQDVWISNNYRSASFLEQGWSQEQAPAGMAAITLAEAEARFANVRGREVS